MFVGEVVFPINKNRVAITQIAIYKQSSSPFWKVWDRGRIYLLYEATTRKLKEYPGKARLRGVFRNLDWERIDYSLIPSLPEPVEKEIRKAHLFSTYKKTFHKTIVLVALKNTPVIEELFLSRDSLMTTANALYNDNSDYPILFIYPLIHLGNKKTVEEFPEIIIGEGKWQELFNSLWEKKQQKKSEKNPDRPGFLQERLSGL